MKLKNNTILITGGSSGIGLGLAKAFLQRDNTVIVTGRNVEKLEKVKVENPGLITMACDVSNPKEIHSLQNTIEKEYPELNILINNAGVMKTINLQNTGMSDEELTKELDINVKGTIWMNDAFLPLLKEKTNAASVSVSSGLAFAPLPISPVYCASKSAVHSYTVSLRAQMKNTGIKVFELAPPATATELLGTFDPNDMEGTKPMTVDQLVAAFLKGFEKDKLEILPGQASQLKFMSRFFPGVINKVLSKPVDRMHNQ
jgi:uncharacterized oxidoreductase